MTSQFELPLLRAVACHDVARTVTLHGCLSENKPRRWDVSAFVERGGLPSMGGRVKGGGGGQRDSDMGNGGRQKG